jgi:hypothetical protein
MPIYRKPNNADDQRWRSFGGRINPGRNYAIFGFLANVRGGDAVVEPRGMPFDAGWYSSDDNDLYITEEEDGCAENCSAAQAASWVASGSSKYIEHNGKKAWVSHPDWHSHSWLTADEFSKAVKLGIEAQQESVKERWPDMKIKEPEYEAMIAAMRCFEMLGYESRVVFWFDN